MKKLVAGFGIAGFLMVAQAAHAVLESATVTPSFQACRHVQILENELSEDQQFEFMINRSRLGIQKMPEMKFFKGLANESSIQKSIHLMKLVADKKISNIRDNLTYYAAVKSCVQDNQRPLSQQCQKLLQEFDYSNQSVIPQLRRELALAMRLVPGSTYAAVPKAHINASLRAIPGLANPAGGTPLSQNELHLAETDFAKDLTVVRKQVEEQLALTRKALLRSNKHAEKSFDESSQRIEFLKIAYNDRLTEHQAKYARILAMNPHLAFYPEAALVSTKKMSRQDVVNAIDDLFNAGVSEIASIEDSRKQNELEFSRINGDAVWRSYFMGEVELLQFVTSPVIEDVLKENAKYCAIAERLLQRVSIKDMQNLVATNLIFGVGPGAGLFGLSVHGVMSTAHAAGIARGLPIVRAVKVSSNITLGVMVGGNALRFQRNRSHGEADPLLNLRDRN